MELDTTEHFTYLLTIKHSLFVINVIITHDEQAGLKVSDSDLEKTGVQLLVSHQVELDVYTNKDAVLKILLISDRTKKKNKIEKALKEPVWFHFV